MSWSTISPEIKAGDIWDYETRTLTQTKFPFWSAIITQTGGSTAVPSNALTAVDIQPPSNETWFVNILFSLSNTGSATFNNVEYVMYCSFDGTNEVRHATYGTYYLQSYAFYQNPPVISITQILTNTLYARLKGFNGSYADTLTYGYSGFKLSKPLWGPNRIDPPVAKPFKLSTDLPLPDPIKPLDKYKALILGIDPANPNDYGLAVILEENTPLAIDPVKNEVVERVSVYVSAQTLTQLIASFIARTLDPKTAGYVKYLEKWLAEGIDLKVPF